MPDRFQERLMEAVRQSEEESVGLLCDLIRYPSLPGEEEPAIRFLAGRFRALSGETSLLPIPPGIKEDPDYTFAERELHYEGRHNLAHTRKGGGQGRSLIMQSHVDVVPAVGWEEAFIPKVEAGKVFGRGACDAKGQVVTLYWALRALDRAGVRLRGDVITQIAIEEEFGGNGALALLMDGPRADAALILEGTRLHIHPANRGAIWFCIRVEGRSVHMGRKHEGINAIEKSMEIIRLLQEYEIRLVAESQGIPLFERYERPVQVNIGIMRAGDWPATVPGSAVLEGGVGFLPNKPMSAIKTEMASLLASIRDPWTKEHITLEFPKLHNDAYRTDPDHPSVSALSEACRSSGLPSEVFGWNVSCDARLYHHRGQMPAIVFGPGDIAQAHATGESIEIAQMRDAALAIALFLTRWCGAGK
ncbi:MAG: ArgE/DapE family deacylase [Armatimonadetes bacterium]|nr:ArgE/DapE family deacylase [Armatimonadota bacterium]